MCSFEKETIKQIFRFQSQQCPKENTRTHVGLIDFGTQLCVSICLIFILKVFLTFENKARRMKAVHSCYHADNCAPPVLCDFAEVIIMCGFGE